MTDTRRARFAQELLDEIRRLRGGGGDVRPLILVVDDDEATTMALEALLSAENFEVVTSPNGVEALVQVQRRRPRAILTDMRMPEMDGSELCRRLAADDATRDIPVFVITGHDEAPGDVTRHAQQVLRKPLDTDQVISLLRMRTA